MRQESYPGKITWREAGSAYAWLGFLSSLRLKCAAKRAVKEVKLCARGLQT